jgi:hypothetical protein
VPFVAYTCAAGYTFNVSTDKCEKTNSVAANESCPSGYASNGSECVKIIDKSCPSGYVPQRDASNTTKYISCLRTSDSYPVSACPSGYEYHAGTDKCAKTSDIVNLCPAPDIYTTFLYLGDTVPVSSCDYFTLNELNPYGSDPDNPRNYCSDGYYFDDSSGRPLCIKKSTSIAKQSPPGCYSSFVKGINSYSGAPYNETTCYYPRPDLLSCPSGYTVSDGRCQTTTTITVSCSSGWTLSGSQCTQLVQLNPNCSSGYSFNASTDKCEKPPVSHDYSCNAGWTLSGSQCTQLVQLNPNCASGYSFVGSTNKCEKSPISYDYSCNAGWTLSGSQCSRLLQLSPVCSSGYAFVGATDKCEKPAVSYDYSCNAGWTLSGSQCVRDVFQTPTCGSGYTMDYIVDKCVSPTSTYLNNCIGGYVPNHGALQCEKITVATPVCVPGTLNTSTDTCESAIIAYTYSCDPSWVVQGGNCERLLTSPVVCSTGFSYVVDTNQCQKPERTYDRTCDAGWTLSGVTCSKLNVSAPICSTLYSYHNTNDRCETPQTPHGYICGDLSWTHTGSACERLLTESLQCDAGLSYDLTTNQCQGPDLGYNYDCPSDVPPWLVVGSTCERTLYDPAICATDEQLVNDQCVFFDNNVKSYQCPDYTYALVATTCEKFIFTAADCDGDTFSPLSNDCVKQESAPTDVQCGDEWSLVDSLCKKSSLLDKVLDCDLGFEQLPLTGECLRVDFDYPTYTCPISHPIMTEGMVCESLTEDIVPVLSYSCPTADSTLDGNQCLISGESTVCENPAHELVDLALDGEPENLVCRYYETETQLPVFTCPVDHVLGLPGVCVKEIITDPTYHCSADFVLDAVENTCTKEQISTVPFDLSCDATFELSGTYCFSIEFDVPVFSCPLVGQSLAGSFCYSTSIETEAPLLICDNMNVDGDCEQYVYTTPDYSCPPDYQPTAFGTECILDTLDEEVDPIALCLDGYTYTSGVCSLLETMPSEVACPDISWTLNGAVCDRTMEDVITSITCDTGEILFENQCYLTQTTAMSFGCRDGFTFNATDNVCDRSITEVEAILYTCLPGYNLIDTNCIKEESEVVTVSCPEVSHELIGVRCYEFSEDMGTPTNTCDSGFTDTGTHCTNTNEFPAELSCFSASYVYNAVDNTCENTVETTKTAKMVCDLDYVAISSALCQKTISSLPPELVCPLGSTLTSGRCLESTVSVVEQGYCDTGYEKELGQCVKHFTQLPTYSCNAPAKQQLSKCFTTSTVTEVAVEVCDN